MSALGASDSLQPVRSVSTGSNRAVTPSKIVPRTSTPQRVPTPLRHGSANKERDLANIASDPNVVNRSSSRSMSRRKQRQWENKHLFNVEFGKKSNAEEENTDEHELPRQRYAFNVDWRSKFAELFEFNNQGVLESFRTCAEGVTLSSSHSNRRIRKDEWRDAELAWMNVEKRLRNVMFRSLVNSEALRAFVEALELVVLSFVEQRALPDHALLPAALKSILVSSPALNKDGNAVLALKESAFHRLLLHGTCQFYGVQSKSALAGPGGKQKITVLQYPNRKSRMVANKVSLLGFLHNCILGAAGDAAAASGADGEMYAELSEMLAQSSLQLTSATSRDSSYVIVTPDEVLVDFVQESPVG